MKRKHKGTRRLVMLATLLMAASAAVTSAQEPQQAVDPTPTVSRPRQPTQPLAPAGSPQPLTAAPPQTSPGAVPLPRYNPPPPLTPVTAPNQASALSTPSPQPLRQAAQVQQPVVIQFVIADVNREFFARTAETLLNTTNTDQIGRHSYSRVVSRENCDAVLKKLREKEASFTVLARPQLSVLNGTAGRLMCSSKAIPKDGIKGMLNLKAIPTIVDDKSLRLNMEFARITLPGQQTGNEPPPVPVEELTVEAILEDGECLISVVPQKVFASPKAEPAKRIRIIAAEPKRVKTLPPRPVAQAPTARPWPNYTLYNSNPRNFPVREYPAYPTAVPAAVADANHRVVTIAAHGAQLANVCDRADVLLITPPSKEKPNGQVQVICENAVVCRSRMQSEPDARGGHWVSLLVKKDLVEKLLISEQLGQLRLTLHRPAQFFPSRTQAVEPTTWQAAPPVAVPIESVVPVYAGDLPAIEPPAVQPPAPASPQSEIKQLLQEIRLLRQVIQGVRDDVSQLKRSVSAQPTLGPVELQSSRVLTVKEGLSINVRSEKPFTRIAIADPGIVELVQYQADELSIIGRSPGETNLTFWRAGNREPRIIRTRVLPARPTVTGLPADMASDVARAHEKIRDHLDAPVELHVEDEPLSETLKALQEALEINIVIDVTGLEEEGIKPSHPISVDVDSVRLSSILHLILEPLNLDYVIEDEVLKVTSKQRAGGRLTVRAYDVSALVSPNDQDATSRDLDTLTDLIPGIIQPDSWDEVGGPGTIRSSESTKTLVVRQSHDAHSQIAHLLTVLKAQKESLSQREPQPQAPEDSKATRPAASRGTSR